MTTILEDRILAVLKDLNYDDLGRVGDVVPQSSMIAIANAVIDEVRAMLPTDGEIVDAAMEYGKTAYSGYAGPGPRSQFHDGAKWVRGLFAGAS
jgi:hypothetical protein